MSLELVFATNNQNKIREIKAMFGDAYAFLSLEDINCQEDIPETQPTIEGNAIQKAQYVYDNYGRNCFAEDSGLEVDHLGGEPGVYSARYAGPDRNDEHNIRKVLDKLEGVEQREAQFRTVIAIIIDGKVNTFEGIIRGSIHWQKEGDNGFGYDPIFIPEEHTRTFAQMGSAEKNRISHRARAITKFKTFLEMRLV